MTPDNFSSKFGSGSDSGFGPKPVFGKTNSAYSDNDVHNRSDVDSGPIALHHTLGYNAGQAASGQELYALKQLVAELTARVEALEAP